MGKKTYDVNITDRYQIIVTKKIGSQYLLCVFNESGQTVINSKFTANNMLFDEESTKILEKNLGKIDKKIKMLATTKTGKGHFIVEDNFKKKIYRPFQTH